MDGQTDRLIPEYAFKYSFCEGIITVIRQCSYTIGSTSDVHPQGLGLKL